MGKALNEDMNFDHLKGANFDGFKNPDDMWDRVFNRVKGEKGSKEAPMDRALRNAQRGGRRMDAGGGLNHHA